MPASASRLFGAAAPASGRATSRVRNSANASPPVRRVTGIAGKSGAAGRLRHNNAPPTAPISNDAIWTNEPLITNSSAAASKARAARGRSGQRFRAMLHTAWATSQRTRIARICGVPS